MRISIIRAGKGHGSAGRRRASVGVESMESRALLTSAAVAGAIASIPVTEAYVQKGIAAEVATLQGNITTIEKSTATFLTDYAKGDKTLTSLAVRDETYAIGQQLYLIDLLGSVENQFDSALNAGVAGLKSGRLDPATLPGLLTASETFLTSAVTAIDKAAVYELDGLVGTFKAGKT